MRSPRDLLKEAIVKELKYVVISSDNIGSGVPVAKYHYRRITEAMEIPGKGCLIRETLWEVRIDSGRQTPEAQSITFAPGMSLEGIKE